MWFNNGTILKKTGGIIITIYERMIFERQRLEKEIESIQSKMKEFPDGKLICTHNGSNVKWYQSDGRSQTYIPKKKRKLAEQLAAKKYLSLQAEDLLHEQKAIDFYLRHHAANNSAEQLLLDTSGYAELLSPFFKPLSQELLDWMNSPYVRSEKYPEQLIHKTISGDYVRSKSEGIIAMVLYINRIPFRYECALQLGENIIFPDFTIRHPETGQIFYWEHFGMMDNTDYFKKAYARLEFYTSHGIVPSIQLLTTFETKEKPLDYESVEYVVKQYFQ
ncbi:MAG: ATPase [Roseburia sp.]|nr:ATPase [Roseburia sp.]